MSDNNIHLADKGGQFMSAWSDKYLGIPWRYGGRDREGIDCWGLVSLVYLKELKIELLDFDSIGSSYSNACQSYLTSGLMDNWVSRETPIEYCIVLFNWRGEPYHVGVWTQGHVLHVLESGDSNCIDLDYFVNQSRMWSIRGYYEYKQ